MSEEHVLESLPWWKKKKKKEEKERIPWMGKFVGFSFAIAFAGFFLCYFSLLHKSQSRYYAGMVAQEARRELIFNSSFVKSKQRVLEALEQPEEAEDQVSLYSGSAASVSVAPAYSTDVSVVPDDSAVRLRTFVDSTGEKRWNPNTVDSSTRYSTDLKHVVFGIGASAPLWESRKEYIKLWWRPAEMRGYVWFDEHIPGMNTSAWDRGLPKWKISSNTSGFKYTHKHGGWRSAIRISRIVSETFRLGLPDVHWFVMGDDDTVFVADNLVTVLSKYDHREFYYIGGNSESHIQNQYFTFNMAFGGGGFAISYPLAKALEKMQDKCLSRYEHLFGSDDRVQACVAELGVGFTREPGFHQFDINGNPFGLLAAHPIAPLVSVHHMDVLDPFFSNKSRVESVRHLLNAGGFDPGALLQQSICYDRRRRWTFSVSWGYAAQIFRGIVSPRELEKPVRTFTNWQHRDDFLSYPFNTRPLPTHPCHKPFVFEFNNIFRTRRSVTISHYTRQFKEKEEEEEERSHCPGRITSPQRVETVRVSKSTHHNLLELKGPRRNCCRVKSGKRKGAVTDIEVAPCKDGEIIALYQ